MASAITVWGASYVLNTLFGTRNPAPAYYYVALCLQPPGTQADGSQLTEPPIDSGYSRAYLSNDTLSFGMAVDGVIATTSEVVYGVATADWPVVTHYALCDSLVGGNVYLYGSFNSPRRVRLGDQARIPAQALSLSVTSLSSALSATF